MPRKLRQLRADLRREGFRVVRQRGSHETWAHPLLSDTIRLAGHDGDDAHHYQEQIIRDVIEKARQAKRA